MVAVVLCDLLGSSPSAAAAAFPLSAITAAQVMRRTRCRGLRVPGARRQQLQISRPTLRNCGDEEAGLSAEADKGGKAGVGRGSAMRLGGNPGNPGSHKIRRLENPEPLGGTAARGKGAGLWAPAVAGKGGGTSRVVGRGRSTPEDLAGAKTNSFHPGRAA